MIITIIYLMGHHIGKKHKGCKVPFMNYNRQLNMKVLKLNLWIMPFAWMITLMKSHVEFFPCEITCSIQVVLTSS